MTIIAKITNLKESYSNLSSSELRTAKIKLVSEFKSFYKGSTSDRNHHIRKIWKIGK